MSDDTEEFLYMAVVKCYDCNQVSRLVKKLDFELPIDGEVPVPPYCPQCGVDHRSWDETFDIQAEYEIETVLPSEERSR